MLNVVHGLESVQMRYDGYKIQTHELCLCGLPRRHLLLTPRHRFTKIFLLTDEKITHDKADTSSHLELATIIWFPHVCFTGVIYEKLPTLSRTCVKHQFLIKSNHSFILS